MQLFVYFGRGLEIRFQDLAFLPFQLVFIAEFIHRVVEVKAVGFPHVLEFVAGVSSIVIISLIYFPFEKSSFCQLNFMEIIRLSQSLG